MTKQERADYVGRRLAELYPSPAIPLVHRDAYSLLVAVVLSAHTTDVSVNKATPRLWAAFGATPAALAQAPIEQIREIIRPVGLSPTKSKAIKELSRLIVE